MVILLLLTAFLANCQKKDDEQTAASGNTGNNPNQIETPSLPPSQEIIEKGRILSMQHCKGCHLYTPAALLPRKIWERDVLPRMGAFMGIYEKEPRHQLVEGGEAKKIIEEANVYPLQPMVDSVSWAAIKAYYLEKSPDTLPRGKSVSMPVKQRFAVSEPKNRVVPPMTTMVHVGKKSGLIYHSDVKRGISPLNVFAPSGELLQAIALRSPTVKLREKNGALWALIMGSFSSSDAPTGSLIRISKKQMGDPYNAMEVLIDKLRRPVDIAYADLDGDGDEDAVIAQYGNWAGQLEWFENEGGKYVSHLLLAKTGAEEVEIADVNRDGKPDILAMIAQADESVYAFLNQGKGKFSLKKLIQVPPTFGSVYFEYVDIDQDGKKDIIHVSGDNADYDAIPKPYHGIRIYLRKEGLNFEQSYFFPLNGAYKTISRDFDGDGDFDIAAISFFPDYKNSPEESFVILENQSKGLEWDFSPFTIPEFRKGRWIVMDSGDLDGDEDADLVLGSFVVQDPYGDQSGIKEIWKAESPSFLMLFNQWDSGGRIP